MPYSSLKWVRKCRVLQDARVGQRSQEWEVEQGLYPGQWAFLGSGGGLGDVGILGNLVVVFAAFFGRGQRIVEDTGCDHVG